MKKALWAILSFVLLVLAITSPFAALASLMLFFLAAAFVRTLWIIVETLVTGTPNEPSS